MTIGLRHTSGIALLALLLLAGAEGARAQGPNPEHEGAPLFQLYCADCHGVRANGKGRRAGELEKRPTDLTRLRASHGDDLDLDWLVRTIDGRRTVRAHGAGDMPVWGEKLVQDVPDFEMREQARLQIIESLAEYVLSIQRD